jgi:hypothetical protein
VICNDKAVFLVDSIVLIALQLHSKVAIKIKGGAFCGASIFFIASSAVISAREGRNKPQAAKDCVFNVVVF